MKCSRATLSLFFATLAGLVVVAGPANGGKEAAADIGPLPPPDLTTRGSVYDFENACYWHDEYSHYSFSDYSSESDELRKIAPYNEQVDEEVSQETFYGYPHGEDYPYEYGYHHEDHEYAANIQSDDMAQEDELDQDDDKPAENETPDETAGADDARLASEDAAKDDHAREKEDDYEDYYDGYYGEYGQHYEPDGYWSDEDQEYGNTADTDDATVTKDETTEADSATEEPAGDHQAYEEEDSYDEYREEDTLDYGDDGYCSYMYQKYGYTVQTDDEVGKDETTEVETAREEEAAKEDYVEDDPASDYDEGCYWSCEDNYGDEAEYMAENVEDWDYWYDEYGASYAEEELPVTHAEPSTTSPAVEQEYENSLEPDGASDITVSDMTVLGAVPDVGGYDEYEYFGDSCELLDLYEYGERELYKFEPEPLPKVMDDGWKVSWVGLFEAAAKVKAEGTIVGVIVSLGSRSLQRFGEARRGLSSHIKEIGWKIPAHLEGEDRSADHAATRHGWF